jgi:hypothetical protein
LIDKTLKNIETFLNSCNNDTKVILYNLNDTFEELINIIQSLSETKFNHLGFVFENNNVIVKMFINNAPFISLSHDGNNIEENLTTTFIKYLISIYNIETLDFLACDLLNEPIWKSYFQFLQNHSSDKNLIVRASDDKSGNLKDGGDWILETTNEDIRNLYFNDNIENYTNLLDNNGSYFNLILSNESSNNIYSAGASSQTNFNYALMRGDTYYNDNSNISFDKNIVNVSMSKTNSIYITDETSNNLYVNGFNPNNVLGSGGDSYTLRKVTDSNLLNKKVLSGYICYVWLGYYSCHVITDEPSNNLYSSGYSGTLSSSGITFSIRDLNYPTGIFSKVNNNKKVIMVTGMLTGVFILTDEPTNNLYRLGIGYNYMFGNNIDYRGSTTFIRNDDPNISSKKIIWVACNNDRTFVLTDDESNNLYATGGLGYLGLNSTNNIINSFQNVKMGDILNKRIEKIITGLTSTVSSDFGNNVVIALTNESSNNMYICGKANNALGINSSTTNLLTFTKVNQNILNKKIINANISTNSITIITDESVNNIYSCGGINGYDNGLGVNNIEIKTFTNVTNYSKNLLNKNVKLLCNNNLQNTNILLCITNTENNNSLYNQIYYITHFTQKNTPALYGGIYYLNNSQSYFRKITAINNNASNKKFTKINYNNSFLVAFTNETSNNLYACGVTPIGTFKVLTNISTILNSTSIFGKKIIDISIKGLSYPVIYVITDEDINNLYGCGYTYAIGNSNNSNNFVNITQGITGKKIVKITTSNNTRMILTNDSSNNYYACGSNSYGIFGNGIVSNNIYTLTNITNGIIYGKKFIDLDSSETYKTILISNESSNNLYCCGQGYLGNGINNSTPQTTFIKITNNIENIKIIKSSSLYNTNNLYCTTKILTEVSDKKNINRWITNQIINNINIRSITYFEKYETIIAIGTNSTNNSLQIRNLTDNETTINTNTITQPSNTNPGNSIVYAKSLERLCLVGNGGIIYTSDDGTTWTQRTNPTTSNIGNLNSICWSSDKSLFCACGSNGPYGKILLTSSDGIAWSERQLPNISPDINNPTIFYSVCWSPSLSKFCVVGEKTQGPSIYLSSDGITWIYYSNLGGDFKYNNNILITDTTTFIIKSVCWSPLLNKFCAIGYNNNNNNLVSYTSNNGINWVINNVTTILYKGEEVIWADDLQRFICRFSNTNNGYFAESTDGISWTILTYNSTNTLSSASLFYSSAMKSLIVGWVSTTNTNITLSRLTTNMYTIGGNSAYAISGMGTSIGYDYNYLNVSSKNISGKTIIDVTHGDYCCIITTNESKNNIYLVGYTAFNDSLGIPSNVDVIYYFKNPENFNNTSYTYTQPISSSSVSVTLNTTPLTTTDSSGNTIISQPVKYAPKTVNIGTNNKITFPDPTKNTIEIAPVSTVTAVQNYAQVLNVSEKNQVTGYIKLEPAGTTFENHISLEFNVDPFIQPVVYFKSSTDPVPILIPSSNNSSNNVYYTSNTSTGLVVLYTKHFSEAIVTQDQSILNPPLNFTLSTFNTSLAMGISGELLKEQIPTLNTDAIAEYYVNVNDMRNVFMFQTDSKDINDSSSQDIKYFIRKSQWPSGLVLNPCHAWVQTSKQIAISDKEGLIPDNRQLVKHDFIRHIAKSLFNTHLGVDLFSNESELKYDLAYKGHNLAWRSIWDSINLISDVSLNTTTYQGLYGSDASYGYYLTNDLSNNSNICRQLLNQVITSAPGRLQSLNTYAIDISNGYYSVPLNDADSISFKLTLQPATNQHLILNSATPIPSRTYQIRINLKNNVSNNNTHSDGVNVIVNDTSPNTYMGVIVNDNFNLSYPSNY